MTMLYFTTFTSAGCRGAQYCIILLYYFTIPYYITTQHYIIIEY